MIRWGFRTRRESEHAQSTPAYPGEILCRRGVIALAVSAPGLVLAKPQAPVEPVSALLRRLFGGDRDLRNFGQIFRARQPDAAARLMARLHGREVGTVRAGVAALRQADFAAGRVVVIDGWVLARAEAEACAVIAGSSSP